MSSQKLIEEQFKRIEALQKQFEKPNPGQDEIKLADGLRADRAQTLRKNLQALERQRGETVARFDAEIASVKGRIAALEKPGDLEFARQVAGSGNARRPAKPATAAKKQGANISRRKKS